MNNQARQLLKNTIREQGFNIVHDSRRLGSLLKDYAKGQYKREIFLLVLTAREGVIDALIARESVPLKVMLEQLSTKLHEDFGIELVSANWAVSSWILVLDLRDNIVVHPQKLFKPERKLSSLNAYIIGLTALLLLVSAFFISRLQSEAYVVSDIKIKPSSPVINKSVLQGSEVKKTDIATTILNPVEIKPQIRQQSFSSLEPEMVTIPAGSYTMGCVDMRDNVENACTDDEKPVHKVTIAEFALAKTEITFDQWEHCVAAGVCEHKNDKAWGRGSRPVIYVSWNNTQTYLKWLNKQTGKNYRLPTEAEWEYAVRAGSDTTDPWGNSVSCNNTIEYKLDCEHSKGTSPVGSHDANAYGLYDMTGNVWEWVQDCYHKNYEGAPSDGQEWSRDCEANATRVVRGGMWFYQSGQHTRSADRYQFTPDYRSFYLGFRVALSQIER